MVKKRMVIKIKVIRKTKIRKVKIKMEINYSNKRMKFQDNKDQKTLKWIMELQIVRFLPLPFPKSHQSNKINTTQIILKSILQEYRTRPLV